MAGNPEFSLRKGTEDDCRALAALEKKAYPAVHQAWTEENFKAELEKPYSESYVLTDEETDQHVIGYIVFWLMFEECQILNVAVDPAYRGKGYAKNMLRKAIDLALRKDLRRALLNVRKSNLSAIGLYQSVGFLITHIRKKFYADGEDAYEMILDLSGSKLEF